LPAAIQAVLTAKGEAKLDRVVAAAKLASMEASKRGATQMRRRASAIAPSPEEEARVLSRGFATPVFFGVRAEDRRSKSNPTGIMPSRSVKGGYIGTPNYDRFYRGRGMVDMQVAILDDPITITIREDIISADTGRPARINRRTGFFWMRRRGEEGPTLPFNRALVQAYEFGGATWVVVPRPDGFTLEPEPYIFTPRMVKTVRPYRMYTRAMMGGRETFKRSLNQMLRQKVRSAGLT